VVQTAFSDIRIYVNVFLGYLTILFIVENKEDLKKYFNVFVLILLTQLTITIVSSYFISQVKSINTFYSGTETYLMSVPFLYFLFLLKRKNSGIRHSISPIFLFIGLLIVVLFIFVVPSRGRMIAFAFPLILYLFYSQKWQYAILFPILVLLAIYFVQLINPNFYNYFLWKFTTFNPSAENADSSRTRYVELVNILNELCSNPYYFFFGKGFGGYFQAHFLGFQGVALGDSSFPQSWIAEGKFYKPHGTWLYFILKYGVVMTIILYYNIGALFLKAWKRFKSAPQNLFVIIGLCFLFNLPGLSIIMFSSKLQILFGLLTGFLYLSIYFTNKYSLPLYS
jgi:hypothetical protein